MGDAIQQTDPNQSEYVYAYMYGQTLASDPRYSNSSWNEIEPTVRRYWEMYHKQKLSWTSFSTAVYQAWLGEIR